MTSLFIGLGLVVAFAATSGCAYIKKPSKPKSTIVGGLADIDAEEAVTEEKTGEKGKVRVICRWVTETGSHFRKRKCYLVSQSEERRRDDQERMLKMQNLSNVRRGGDGSP